MVVYAVAGLLCQGVVGPGGEPFRDVGLVGGFEGSAVGDTGFPCGGASAANLPFVFDRFYRSPTARSLPGFGLAIVRPIAETYGGSTTAEPWNTQDGSA